MPPPEQQPRRLSVADWLCLPELERELIAHWFRERYNVEPDPTILRELEGGE